VNKYVLSVAAELDLDQIWDYIAEDNIDAADRWIDKLFDAFQSLAEAPGMGHRREDLTTLPVLFWPVGGYLILYRVQAEWIEIAAVTQGARDIPNFLSQRTKQN
jgi:plasmid stabilization system protein ParE